MTSDRQDIFVSLRELFSFVLRGALFAGLLAGVVVPAVYVWKNRQPAVFRAEATLLVTRSLGGFTQLGLSPVTAPPIDLAAYRVAAGSDAVLLDALRFLGIDDPTVPAARGLRNVVGVSAEVGRDSSLLRVEASGPTARIASERADAVASALVTWDQRRATESIRRVIATLEQQIEVLSSQIAMVQSADATDAQSQVDGLARLRAEQQQQLGYARAVVISAEGMLSLLQTADANVVQVAPRPLLSAVVAGVLALAFAYGLLLLRAALTTRLTGSDEITDVTGLPVLAEFPTAGRRKDERLREAASYLRTSLLFSTEEVHPRVFLVTSASEGEGKTTIARYLSESFVRYGYRTLLVDADLRAPALATVYGVGEAAAARTTTESWLTHAADERGMLSIAVGLSERLDLIPQFRSISNAPELLGRGFRSALAQWQEYDVIVIDSPPILLVPDALTIAPHCSGTLLVVDRKRASRRRLTAAISTLQRLGVEVLGVVANRVGEPKTGGGYGSTYGSGGASTEGAMPPDREAVRLPVREPTQP